jgi:murein L,D-transpeptidase YafK
MPPAERVRRAEVDKRPIVAALFAAAGVSFPPKALLFRAFKQDRELEIWAASERSAPLTLVTTYQICRISGDLGPKRREGDRQVPEGFYHIHYLWPDSAYHLELKIGYPNDLDRHLSEHVPEGPGGEIMIHGSCASVGCLAMSDERIEEIWSIASAFQKGDDRVIVHIFPARDMAALLRDEDYRRHWAFWANLKEGYDLFERTHRLFRVEADWHARYWFR